MEDLITVFMIIIIAIWSVLSKIRAKRKAASKAKPPDKAGLVTKLHAFFDDIQKRIEQQAKQGDKDSTGWEQLLGRSKTERSQTDYEEESLEDLILEYDEPPAVRKEPPAPPPRRAVLRRPDPIKRVPSDTGMQPGLDAQKPTSTRMFTDRSELHRAVIWSEILGPPVALKDPYGNHR